MMVMMMTPVIQLSQLHGAHPHEQQHTHWTFHSHHTFVTEGKRWDIGVGVNGVIF